MVEFSSAEWLDILANYLEERVKVPWPMTTREAVLHTFELEYFQDDLIVVLMNTVIT